MPSVHKTGRPTKLVGRPTSYFHVLVPDFKRRPSVQVRLYIRQTIWFGGKFGPLLDQHVQHKTFLGLDIGLIIDNVLVLSVPNV